MEEPVTVPETGIANWYMYYFCPDCSVQLTFNRHDPHHHACPVCGKVFSGEPYDSAWWRMINGANSSGIYNLALLYLLTGETCYARKGTEILCRYADYYRGYEIHGDIPYNEPGKLGAQTLDDANFIRTITPAYDLLESAMTEAEREHIKQDLLLPAAEFFMLRRKAHQHNHELIISAAVGMIALILDREDMIQWAVYDDYGLLYQLEHGVTESGMWFEGTFGYHFYALEGFFQYERFAVHTKHSQIHHPLYAKMLKTALNYAQPDFDFPKLNDTYVGHGTLMGKAPLYEFAYRELGDPELLKMLNRMYEKTERAGLDAFLWGVEELPDCEAVTLPMFHPPVGKPGNTILRSAHDGYLLFKQDEFGGEHDHYDRLGISWMGWGRKLAADLGTTAYGAVLHYDFYKNTGAHNTVAVEECNQPPARAELTRYEERDGMAYVEGCVDWKQDYEMPPIFVIPDWDQAVYQGISMKRKLAWSLNTSEDQGQYLAECFIVNGAGDRTVDWNFHVGGKRTAVLASDGREIAAIPGSLSEKKPLRHMENVWKVKSEQFAEAGGDICVSRYDVDGIHVDIHSLLCGQELYLGEVPDNPSVKNISQVVERYPAGSVKETLVFLNFIIAYENQKPVEVLGMGIHGDTAEIVIAENGEEKRIGFSIGDTIEAADRGEDLYGPYDDVSSLMEDLNT